jgi:hypothetical protein
MGRVLAAALVAGTLLVPGTANAGTSARARLVAAAPSSSVPLAASVALPSGETTLTVFEDPLGDAPATALDLGVTKVWSDASGLVTIRAEAPGGPELRRGVLYALFLDTDLDAKTGNRAAGGADALVVVSGATRTVGLARWTGIQWSFAVPQASLAAAWDGGPVIALSRDELGGTAAFRFWQGASYRDGAGAISTDVAPDRGVWRHDLELAGPASGPGLIADTMAPHAAALASTGRRGGPARLRYRVWDDSGITRERIEIFRGGRRVAVLQTPFAPSGPGVTFWATWRVPAAGRGRWTFCIRAWDPAGQAAARRCAPLRIAR